MITAFFSIPVAMLASSGGGHSSVLFIVFLVFLLTAGVLLAIVLLGGIAVYAMIRHRAGKARQWTEAAQPLGLELEPFAPHMSSPAGKIFGSKSSNSLAQSMTGYHRDIPVKLGVRTVVRHSRRRHRTDYFTYVKAFIHPPLQGGIFASSTDVAMRFFSDLGLTANLQTGDHELDRAYAIGAVDQDFARSLVREASLRAGLIHSLSGNWRLTFSDDTVTLERKTIETSPIVLRSLLDQATDLVHRFHHAKTTVPPSALEQILRSVWIPFAVRNDLTVDVGTAVMRGRHRGLNVEVKVSCLRGSFRTTFQVAFDQPLGLNLNLSRQGAMAGVSKFFGVQDIQIGNPEFDAAFVVKGNPEDAVRALLTREVQQHLLQMQRETPQLTVHDHGIVAEIDWVVNQAAFLESGLGLVTVTAASLARSNREVATPYRT